MIAPAEPKIAIVNPMIEEDLKIREEFTPLTAEALAKFNVDATSHMDKRLLDKEQYLKGIKQRRDFSDTPIVTEEERRRADLAEKDLQVSVALQLSMDSARNLQSLITPKVMVDSNPKVRVNTISILPGGREEDDDINRLVANDDTKSVVSQWGRRTDQESDTHMENVAKINNEELNEVNVAIRDYVRLRGSMAIAIGAGHGFLRGSRSNTSATRFGKSGTTNG